MDEQMEQLLREEMHELEAHRKRYLQAHPGLRIDREDPEVRLLLETLAFSAVRTRLATVSLQQAQWRRLFCSHFDYLMRSLPTSGILRAEPNAALLETVDLGRGSGIEIENTDGERAHFELLTPLRVVPVSLTHLELMQRRRGYRLVICFSSQFQRTDALGLMRLYIDYLGDYLAALQVQYQIQQHIEHCFIVYDQAVSEQSTGATCRVTFGESVQDDDFFESRNPVEQIRDFFHHPQRSLFINISVPPPRHSYMRFSLCIDLSANYVPDPPIVQDLFVPFAVPIRNTRRDFSRPIWMDGTQVEHPLLHVLGDPDLELWAARGVYELLPSGMAPLLPSSLGATGPGFAIEERLMTDEDGSARKVPLLLLHLPDSLIQKRQVVLDGLWQKAQPLRKTGGRLRISATHQRLPGLQLRLSGPLRPKCASAIQDQPDSLLDLLALKTRSTLNLSELQAVLHALGTLKKSPYEELITLIDDLQIQAVKDGASALLGIRHQYQAHIGKYESEREALVWNFLRKIQCLLAAWNHEVSTSFIVTGAERTPSLPLAEVMP